MTDSEYQYYFHAGTLQTAYEYRVCHYDRETKRATFRVWAPHATSVSVVVAFNYSNRPATSLARITDGGM